MMTFERKKKVSVNMNITPLIDVVFLLLLFFMLTSHFVTKPGIKISLPEAVTAKPQQEDRIAVYIADQSTIYVNNTRVQVEELKAHLESRLAASQNKSYIIIKADKSVNIGLAIHVIDLAKQAKADGVVISTEIPEQR